MIYEARIYKPKKGGELVLKKIVSAQENSNNHWAKLEVGMGGRVKTPYICEECGVEARSTNKTARYCPDCKLLIDRARAKRKRDAEREKRPARKCNWCHGDIPKSRWAGTCSDDCTRARAREYYRKQKERLQAAKDRMQNQATPEARA